MKVKFNSDDNIPLKKTVKLYNMIIAIKSVFHWYNKYYLHVFLEECLYRLQMLRNLMVCLSVLFVIYGPVLR